MTKSAASTVRRVNIEFVEGEGLISLRDAALAAGVTTLTATRRLASVGLVGPGVPVVAYADTGAVGRPSRLFPRVEALEAVLNGVGNRRSQAEKERIELEAAPEATAADADLAAAAEVLA